MIGQTISHYKILEKLGEGGMGVVYKARDMKLDRFVALKFLPPHLSASDVDRTRFIQEARAAAALNHPNVCSIIDIEDFDSSPASTHIGSSGLTETPVGTPAAGPMFIVMEFVNGQTLREKRGSVNFKQAIDIGIQLADGLAAAHEKGIVHRDIKPENVMIRKDGIAQIMDFGLAKLRGSVTRLTKEGSTVGTAAYMSPEQVQGQEIDHRSDLFSLGVLLYELFSGQLPFKGVHETALMYEIVNVDAPPMTSLKPEIDPSLDAIVLECLEKDPNERMQSAKQITVDLKRFKRESSKQRASRITAIRTAYKDSTLPVPGRFTSHRLPWIVATLFLLGMVVLWISGMNRSPVKMQSFHSTILPLEKMTLAPQWGLALSHDGSMLAYVAADSSGVLHLLLRAMNSPTTKEIPGTEYAYMPFWSPDDRFVAFYQSDKIRKVDVSGGPPTAICNAPFILGGSWNQDGVIVIASEGAGISRVSAAGGNLAPVTRLDSSLHEQSHTFPCFLPDGKHILYFARAGSGGTGQEDEALYVTSIDGKEKKRLMPATSNVSFAGGCLLYLRDKTLMARPFDPDKLEIKGEAIPLVDPVAYAARLHEGLFTASNSAIVSFQSSGGESQLVWYESTGRSFGTIGERANYGFASLSPDGKKIAFDVYDPQLSNRDIWLYDIARGIKTRFTFDPSSDEWPIWSPDGNRIIFRSDRRGHADLYQKETSGAATEEILFESGQQKYPTDWSSDGRFLAFVMIDSKMSGDIWILPLDPKERDGSRNPFPFLQTEFFEGAAHFSPDMRWIAYRSMESGRAELYLRPFLSADGTIAINQTRKWQISTNGIFGQGNLVCRWSRDGKRLYYISSHNKLMVADLKERGPTIDVDAGRELFDVISDGFIGLVDVTADGKRFLIMKGAWGTSNAPLTLVTNWDQELKRR
jgi:eukaryotic-like serine/threonine-protein kinase